MTPGPIFDAVTAPSAIFDVTMRLSTSLAVVITLSAIFTAVIAPSRTSTVVFGPLGLTISIVFCGLLRLLMPWNVIVDSMLIVSLVRVTTIPLFPAITRLPSAWFNERTKPPAETLILSATPARSARIAYGTTAKRVRGNGGCPARAVSRYTCVLKKSTPVSGTTEPR